MADIIFHDCETLPFKSGVHAHYEDLKTLDDKTRKKMWLYHYQDNGNSDKISTQELADEIRNHVLNALHTEGVLTGD